MSYDFVTIANYQSPPGWTGSREDQTERSGYRTIEAQVAELISAGQRLDDWRKARHSAEDEGFDTPVYLDKVDGEMRLANIKRNREFLIQKARKEALEKADIEKAESVVDAPMVHSKVESTTVDPPKQPEGVSKPK